jgi:hypothetical protein
VAGEGTTPQVRGSFARKTSDLAPRRRDGSKLRSLVEQVRQLQSSMVRATRPPDRLRDGA